MDRPCAVSLSWPEQTGHPRLAVLTSAKGVGGGPSATMTIKANAPSDECPNLPAVLCSSCFSYPSPALGRGRVPLDGKTMSWPCNGTISALGKSHYRRNTGSQYWWPASQPNAAWQNCCQHA